MASLGRKFTVTFVSAILAFLILLVGQSAWGLLLVLNFKTNPRAIPWSVAVMAVVLYLMWEYLGGRWWPRRTSETRRNYLRASPVPPHIFGIAFVSGVLAILPGGVLDTLYSSWSRHLPTFSRTRRNTHFSPSYLSPPCLRWCHPSWKR